MKLVCSQLSGPTHDVLCAHQWFVFPLLKRPNSLLQKIQSFLLHQWPYFIEIGSKTGQKQHQMCSKTRFWFGKSLGNVSKFCSRLAQNPEILAENQRNWCAPFAVACSSRSSPSLWWIQGLPTQIGRRKAMNLNISDFGKPKLNSVTLTTTCKKQRHHQFQDS